MKQAREIGYRVEKYAEQKHVSLPELSEAAGCDCGAAKSFLKGRSLVSFEVLSAVADKLGVGVSDLLSGFEAEYDEFAVHCMNKFQNPDNRERILDIIDDYMDILDSVND